MRRARIQLQNCLGSTHCPFRGHHHTVVEQHIESATCKEGRRQLQQQSQHRSRPCSQLWTTRLHLIEVRIERTDPRISTFVQTLARQICFEVSSHSQHALLLHGQEREAYELLQDIQIQDQWQIEVMSLR